MATPTWPRHKLALNTDNRLQHQGGEEAIHSGRNESLDCDREHILLLCTDGWDARQRHD